MSFDAGSVVTTLSGRLEPQAFDRFDAANKRSIESATRAEAASRRMARAQGELGAATTRAGAQQATALARTESEMAKLEKTIHRSGAATKLQASELDLLTRRHGELTKSASRTGQAIAQYSRHSDQAAKSLNTLGNVATKGAIVGLGGLAVATAYAVKTAGDFEKQMRNVNSIAKLSESGYKSLSQGVLELAGQTAQAPKVLAEGLYDLVSSGFNAADSLTILKSSAKAATAGLTDTATSTKAVSAVLNAYREPASKAGQVSDTLFETVNRGVITFAELANHIGDVLPFAASLGVALPEVGAAISTMTKEGINAPETMTRVKQVMESLIKPSKDMTAAIKATGAGSGEALVKHKGLEGALEAVIHTTDGSKESLAKLFPNIRALGGALALSGNNAKGAAQDLKAFADTSGSTQKVFDEQSKSAEFAAKRLSSSFQVAGITVGKQVLPLLASEAGKLTQSLEHAARDGSLEDFGRSLVSGLEVAGHVIGDTISTVEDLAHALHDVGGALGIGDAQGIEAFIAAFAAFKGMKVIAPILLATADAFKVMRAAATEGGLASLPGALLSLENPVNALATAAGLAAGAFFLLKGSEKSEADAARDVTAAKQAEEAAITSLNEAVLGEADATFGARKADDALKQAKEHLADVAKKSGKGSAEYKRALQEEREAALQDDAAHVRLRKSHEETAEQARRAKNEAKARVETAKELFKAEERERFKAFVRGDIKGPEAREGLIKSAEKYNRTVQDAARGTALAEISQLQLNRVLAGGKLITDTAAGSVAKLTTVWNQLSKSQQQKLSVTPQAQLAEIGDLVGQLHGVSTKQQVEILVKADNAKAQIGALKAVIAGVPPGKVVKILADAHSAKEQIAALSAAVHGVPVGRVIKILSNAAGEKQKIRELAAAIHAVPPSKSVSINTSAGAAKGPVGELQAAIDGLHGKTVTLTTIARQITTGAGPGHNVRVPGHASGRQRGDHEAAIVGEGQGAEYVVDRTTGRGQIISQPTLMGLSPDDYVIPLEDRFRGRALGLFAMLARDLDVPGFSKGRPAKGKAKGKAHHPMPVPDAIQPLSLPLADIEKKRDDAKTAEGKAKSKVKSEESKIRTLEKDIRTGSRAKKPDHAKLGEYRHELSKERAAHERDSRELAKDKQQLKEWNRTVREARQFAAKIKHVELEVSNDRNAMQLAAAHGDFGSYSAAKDKRIHDLGRLAGLIQEAREHVKTGSDYALELEGQIQQAQIEAGSTAAESPEPTRDKAAEEEESTGETAPERAEQARIERDVALAALTPDLGDDTSAQQRLVNFFGKVLGEVQAEPGPRGGDTAIKQVAEAYRQAQSNLASLTGGGGTNDNSDLQAQLDQRDRKLEVEKQRADTAEQSLQVFGGSGDIGAGGRNAAGAAAGVVVHQTIQTLHPGDPATLRAIGDAATSGIGLQGSRQAVRVQVGP